MTASMSDNNQIILPHGEFYIFEAIGDKDSDEMYYSSEQALMEHINWWLNNRTDAFKVSQRRFEK